MALYKTGSPRREFAIQPPLLTLQSTTASPNGPFGLSSVRPAACSSPVDFQRHSGPKLFVWRSIFTTWPQQNPTKVSLLLNSGKKRSPTSLVFGHSDAAFSSRTPSRKASSPFAPGTESTSDQRSGEMAIESGIPSPRESATAVTSSSSREDQNLKFTALLSYWTPLAWT